MKPLSAQLYDLLPAVHRIRDVENRDTLRHLLAVVAEQVGLVEDNIGQLYDDWFVETCEEWLVPYIGDLLGVRSLHQIRGAGFTQRAQVANTLAYRRRKGTAAVLEQLAHDTTLWSARVVEFFQLLATTQYLNHIRPENLRTPDVRQVDTLAQLDSPFDRIAHTADVRRISSDNAAAIGRGWYNIPNIGIFLWRLSSYTLADATPRPLATGDGLFTFSPLGNPMPLFHQPKTETTITHLAAETDVPAAIRPLAFHLDLQANARQSLGLAPAGRPTRTAYYGPGASLNVTRAGQPIAPVDVTCMNLANWDRPPTRVRGVLSGELTEPLSLTAAVSASTPSVNVAFGGGGSFPAVLAARPSTLADAAALLQDAIQHAYPTPAFQRAQVVPAGKRLLVLPGQAGLAVTFAATASDATTFTELGLNATVPVDAALSSTVKPFPVLYPGRLQVTIAGIGPRSLNLAPLPTTLVDARQRLQDALQAAGGEAEFKKAEVAALDDRLLVVPGVNGPSAGPVTFATDPTDLATVYRLGLNDRVGIDVASGRLAFPLGDAAANVRVTYTYGFSGDLGGGPYDRRYLRRPTEPQPGPYQNTVANPAGLGTLIRVPDDFATLSLALDNWKNVLGQPSAVIEITDNSTYTENLAIDASTSDLVVQAANKRRPVLIGNMVVNGNSHGRLAINGLVVAGAVTVTDASALRQLDVIHTALVPGRGLDAAGEAAQPDAASLIVGNADPDLFVTLDHAICGPVQIPAGIGGLKAVDSILESPLRNKPALITPVLVSGPLAAVALSSALPTLLVTIGAEGPYQLVLRPKPGTLAQARDALEEALQNLGRSQAFTGARVFTAGNRLVVLPGLPLSVRFDPAGPPGAQDPTAQELRLVRSQAEERVGILSAALKALPLSAASPKLRLALGSETGSVNITTAPAPQTLAQMRDALQAAIRAASASAPFAASVVVALSPDNRLLVVPGAGGVAPRFSAAQNDATTLEELSLESDQFVIAASPGGDLEAPPTVLERCTLFGMIHVKELTCASECIFTSPVFAERHQVGCVRFSYVPDGSRTPVRFRCQPDLEIATQKEDEQPGTPAKFDALRKRILGWLIPAFTSTRYGDPGYSQLSRACPVQISTGAEDGSEMGAFSFLKQPMRASNLRASLDEYLRLGLDTGIFYVT